MNLSTEEKRLIDMLDGLDSSGYDDEDKENIIILILESAEQEDTLDEVIKIVKNNADKTFSEVISILFNSDLFPEVVIED